MLKHSLAGLHLNAPNMENQDTSYLIAEKQIATKENNCLPKKSTRIMKKFIIAKLMIEKMML